MENGLRVWCYPQPGVPSVAVMLVVHVGSLDESPANSGVAHFLEHMVFTGTQRWDENETAAVLDLPGADWNGFTERERTLYYAHMPAAADLGVALEWLSQVVFHATLPADKLDKERDVVLQEMGGPEGGLLRALEALGFGDDVEGRLWDVVFPGVWHGQAISGSDATLQSLDLAALRAFYAARYVPQNATLIVVGGVDPAAALHGAREHFGALPGAPRPLTPRRELRAAPGPHTVIVRGPTVNNEFRLEFGFRTVGRGHPDFWPLAVAVTVLERELTQELRYDQGLLYDLDTYADVYDDTGFTVVDADAESLDHRDILAGVEALVAQMRAEPPDARAVADAKATLAGRWALELQDPAQFAERVAQWSRWEDGAGVVPHYAAAIDAVTHEDVARVLRTYFVPERRYLAMHLPAVTLEGDGPTILWALVAVGALYLWRRRRRTRSAAP